MGFAISVSCLVHEIHLELTKSWCASHGTLNNWKKKSPKGNLGVILGLGRRKCKHCLEVGSFQAVMTNIHINNPVPWFGNRVLSNCIFIVPHLTLEEIYIISSKIWQKRVYHKFVLVTVLKWRLTSNTLMAKNNWPLDNSLT